MTMAKPFFEAHASVFVPLQDRDMRQFYRDVLDKRYVEQQRASSSP